MGFKMHHGLRVSPIFALGYFKISHFLGFPGCVYRAQKIVRRLIKYLKNNDTLNAPLVKSSFS